MRASLNTMPAAISHAARSIHGMPAAALEASADDAIAIDVAALATAVIAAAAGVGACRPCTHGSSTHNTSTARQYWYRTAAASMRTIVATNVATATTAASCALMASTSAARG